MSEAFTDAADQSLPPVDDETFEVARLAEEGDDAPVEAEAEEEEKPAIDWEKRAHDKEGLAAKERARRREAERQVRELNGRIDRLEARSKPATEAEEDDLIAAVNALRDDDEDPITDLAQVKRAMKAFLRQQAEETERESAVSAQEREFRTLASSMAEAEADFETDHPDYKEAQLHFKAARRAEFEDMGFAGRELESELAKDLIGLVRRAMSGGRDPAEVVYNLAKKRGFQSGKTQTDNKLKEIAAAAKAGTTPAPGRHGDNRLTPDAVNKLKGAAYDSAWEKLREQERRAG